MATNYKHPGDVVERTAPSGGVTAGTPVVIGSEFLIPLVTAAVGVKFNGALTGVWTLAKTTGVAWTNGLALFWNAGTSKVSTVPTDGMFIGTADKAAASGDTVGNVRLVGPQAFAEGIQAAIADLTEGGGSIGGTQNGDITALVDPAGDSGASLIDGVRENSAKINGILAALRAAGIITT